LSGLEKRYKPGWLLYRKMWRSCVIVLLSLQLSSLLWSTVCGLQCYQCNSFLTPSCAFAGNTDEWATCEDDLCFTAIMSGQFLGMSIQL